MGVLTQRIGHVVKNVHIREQRARLKEHAHPFANRVEARARHRRDIFAVEENFAAVRGICPPIRRSNVVLPIPDGPMMAVILPRGTVSEISSNINRLPREN